MASEHETQGSPTHVVALGTYLSVFVALLVLTAITTAVAFIDLGPMNNVVALGIAALKAAIVILFFMHVKYSSRLIGIVVVTSLFWVFILLSSTVMDFVTRGWLGAAGK